MYSTFMRMHGAKYDYKISYQDITCLYLLFRPDEVSASIVISLEKPIRQGNQKYPHLVLQTVRTEHTMEVRSNVPFLSLTPAPPPSLPA